MTRTTHAGAYDEVARRMNAFSSPVRVALLSALRTPQSLSDIRITKQGAAGPTLTRQTVTWHLEHLIEAGLVRRLRSETGARQRYALDHARLSALVDELRHVMRVETTREAQATFPGLDSDGTPELPPLPRLLLAHGRDEGVAFSLDESDAWWIGREPGCDIHLDHDPYISARNARIVRLAGEFYVTDATSRNGTWLNWKRLAPETPSRLRAGDLVSVGRSHLVFQA